MVVYMEVTTILLQQRGKLPPEVLVAPEEAKGCTAMGVNYIVMGDPTVIPGLPNFIAP